MAYSVLTPFLIPEELNKTKTVNIGDGFILSRILSMLRPHECAYIFTSRKALGEAALAQINSTKALILAGANQLNDTFSILPGLTVEQLRQVRVPIIPFGIGLSGRPRQTSGMSAHTLDILREIHRNIAYSSWRCPKTTAYLSRHIPELKEKFLMTGCPVMYDSPLLDGKPFSTASNRIVVTITERGNFLEREKKIIDFVGGRYKNSEKFLALHQVFVPTERQSFVRSVFGSATDRKRTRDIYALHAYAQKMGFTLFLPKSVDECWSFYKSCDLHYGSRLHAHLFFLSQAKRSFLALVDDRITGFSMALDFPICDFQGQEDYTEYDFEIYRSNCQQHFKTMETFLNYLNKDIL